MVLRRPVLTYPFKSIIEICKSDYVENILIARSPVMAAITLRLSDREVWFVPRPARFDEAFAAVQTAVKGDERA
jgi:hypothetical protein